MRYFQCQDCQKTFKFRQLLVEHARTHSGEKPHPCDVCGKSFAQKGHLTRHRKTHTGEKPHGCGSCGKRFAEIAALRKHQSMHDRARAVVDPVALATAATAIVPTAPTWEVRT